MSKQNRTALILDGLDCANCALKIENAVKKIDGVTAVTLDFTTQKLTIDYNRSDLKDAILDRAASEALRIEPDIRILQDHAEAEEKPESLLTWNNLGLLIGAILFTVALVFDFGEVLEPIVFGISFILVGRDVVLKAIRDLLKGQLFDENFLMSLATLGAFSIRQYPEAVAVMLFYKVGELFQDAAVDHSRKSIKSLLDIRPEYANLEQGSELIKVSPQSVALNQTIVIMPGEKVPLDGIVLEGDSFLDTASITGESLPKAVGPNDQIYSGSINQSGVLKVKVTKIYAESTVAKILDLVENASARKAPTEQFITKFARVYTPIVVAIAAVMALIVPLIIPGATFSEWIYRALIFLVVSCPCALVISIPLGYFGGIGGASKHGILLKGSNHLEALNKVDTVVFDKTGTLTQGKFHVANIVSNSSFTSDEILEAAATAESRSTHPIAQSIVEAYGKVDSAMLRNVTELAGLGLAATVNGKRILAGNDRLMIKNGLKPLINGDTGTLVHVAIDRTYAGYIVIEDEIKVDAKASIAALKDLGIRKIVMLTGDSSKVGEKIASILGISDVYAELLPQDKVDIVERLEKEKVGKGKLVFVGDGINDAPVLTRADVGIAMGALGSDAAIEAADVVLMTDEPMKLATAIRLSRFTQKIVWQNIALAFGVKAVVLILGTFGLASMWEAVFADVGVALLAVFNALRVLNAKA